MPDWSFEKIIGFAVENDYSGIEVRGIQRQMDLPKCREFNSTENIGHTLRLMNDKGLKFVDLGLSAEMHHIDEAERKNNLDEARRFTNCWAGERYQSLKRLMPCIKEAIKAITVLNGRNYGIRKLMNRKLHLLIIRK